MMKFNCSSWCTWGLRPHRCGCTRVCVCVCVQIYEHVCVTYVFVREAWPLNWNGPARGSMSRRRRESYRFLKMRYRFCGGLIYTGIKWKTAGEVKTLRRTGERREKKRFDRPSGLTGVILI